MIDVRTRVLRQRDFIRFWQLWRTRSRERDQGNAQEYKHGGNIIGVLRPGVQILQIGELFDSEGRKYDCSSDTEKEDHKGSKN